MSYDFKKLMSEKNDLELLKVIAGGRNDYSEEAFNAAEEEFKNRNISSDQLEKVKMIYQDQRIKDDNKEKAIMETANSLYKVKLIIIASCVFLAILFWILKKFIINF